MTSTARADGGAPPLTIQLRIQRHRYGRVRALDKVQIDIPEGTLVGFIGADGVGKSTLLGLIAGVRRCQQGKIVVFGNDLRKAATRTQICERIAYMPQGLGQNLYAHLTVAENVTFFGRLFNLQPDAIKRRMGDLLSATGLAPFADRQMGKLSGGMKQKLGLCCALIHQPDLLVLDEPTTGVDPLSRLQFWELIRALRAQTPTMTVVVATSYMDEAEQFDHLVMMEDGRVLAEGSPAALKEKAGAADLDAAYVALLPPEKRRKHTRFHLPPRTETTDGPAVEAQKLTRRFDGFTAVDGVSFSIGRGEIFGFVGPNGSGKTTVMKMVTGLLEASEGEARLFGRTVAAGDIALRRRLGYMSQSFSLYAELGVRQNLALHARLFGIPEAEIGPRIASLVKRFDLQDVLLERAEKLPLGIRQRLSLAVATIHRPDILILDEPTSGVDPIARDTFWRLLVELSREHGTTIFVSTHYLTEANRCDRVALMNAGRILACETPEKLMQERGCSTLEETFISHIREEQLRDGKEDLAPERLETAEPSASPMRAAKKKTHGFFSPRRMATLARREALEVWRDPFRMFAAFLVPVALMLIFGFGLNMDIERLPYAALDYDRSPESRAYLEHFSASRYFTETPPATNDQQVEQRMQLGKIRLAIEIPAGFGRDLKREKNPELAFWIDGTMPYRAETTQGYALRLHMAYLDDLARQNGWDAAASPVQLQTRYWFNQSLESKYAFVPALLAVILIMIPSMLTAVAVVREKELGSITNLYATPVTRLEFLWGKQLPYAGISYLNFVLLTLLVVFVFGIPIGGSVLALALGAVPYVLACTAIGLLVSTFTRTQVGGMFVTMILTMTTSFQYSGLLSPVSSLEGGSYLFGRLFPTSYFLDICVGSFAKDLHLVDLIENYGILILFFLVLSAASTFLLKRQQA